MEPLTPPVPKPPRQTKAALLRARLAEPGGVSAAALMEATGWQAHTLRASLSGLRKAGLILTRRRNGDETIYAVDAGGPVATGAADDGEGHGTNPATVPPDAGDESSHPAAPASLPTEADA